MKLTSPWLTAALISALLSGNALAAETAYAEPPAVSAAAYVLMDADSGRLLACSDPDEPRLIASTTKIMTAMLALEQLNQEETVTIDPAWAGIEGSTMYLAPGQSITVRDLLYGLMLASGNDAAVALACLTAGSVEAFADMMNRRAAELGCANTHFENPNGLDSERHYASARDLALIARAAIRNEDFVRIASTVSATVGELTFVNHNRLLTECEGVFGVKTGYTTAAGRTLVSCCERHGITLICVTLSDPDDWSDHAALYDWAYSAFSREDLSDSLRWEIPVIGGENDEVAVVTADRLSVLKGPADTVSTSVFLPRFVYAPVECGSEAGRVIVRVNGAEAAASPLLFAGNVLRSQPDVPSWRARIGAVFGIAERKIYTLI